MKFLLLCLTIIFLQVVLHAQPPVGKCLEGNCQNGTGRYQLNQYSFYEGGFKNGQFYGQGKIYNPNQWSYAGLFDESSLIRQCKYTGYTYDDTEMRVLFEGTQKLIFSDAAFVNNNWRTKNFYECNGKYFQLIADSGRVNIARTLYDSTRYAYAARFGSNGLPTGKGKIYKNKTELDFDFSSLPPNTGGDDLRIAIQSFFSYNEINFAAFSCISGDCKNGKGITRLNKFSKYEGGFKNGKFSGPGKISHDNGSWYFTGNFQDTTILNYQFYQQASPGSSAELKRKAKALIRYFDADYARQKWNTNNFYYNDRSFFKFEETDTVTWYFKNNLYLKIAPDKQNAVLHANNKQYKFLLYLSGFEITEAILLEHLKRNNNNTRITYTYDPAILSKPVSNPVVKNNPVNNSTPQRRLFNAQEYAEMEKMVAAQFRNQTASFSKVVSEGFMEGGDFPVKFKSAYANAKPGSTFLLVALVKYSSPVTISVPDNYSPSGNITGRGSRREEAGATVHLYSCMYTNQTGESRTVKFEFNVTNSNEPAYYMVIQKDAQ